MQYLDCISNVQHGKKVLKLYQACLYGYLQGAICRGGCVGFPPFWSVCPCLCL